jgi:hypothetical protein
MLIAQKELIINRIIAGCFKCKIRIDNDTTTNFLAYHPDRLQRYLAEEVYQDSYEKAIANGCYDDKQLMNFLLSQGLWAEQKQAKLDGLAKDIEELKLGLWETKLKSNIREMARNGLKAAKAEHTKLLIEVHSYDHLGAAGVASMNKARYLIAASLRRLDGSKLFNENELWAASDFIIEAAAGAISQDKLDEPRLREIARTDPWRTIWAARKGEASVFGISTVDLTDEQRMLSVWSTVYDNIYEHPDCPTDEEIAEDDMLDGWMIAQKRKRDTERGSRTEAYVQNEKIRNSEEVYIPVGTAADAKKVESLNDSAAAIEKRKRMLLLHQRGRVEEQHMPDSQLKIRQEMTKLFQKQVKG